MRVFLSLCVSMGLAWSATSTSMILPENFTAVFTQIITNPKQKVIHYDGEIYFSDTSKLKWSYKHPTQKEVCVSGHALSIVDYDLEQVSYMTIDTEFDFISILKKATLHHKNVYVSKYEDTSYTIQVDSKEQIQSVAFYDNLDNKVQIVFKQVKYGKGSLPAEDMVCNVPQDFDVIR